MRGGCSDARPDLDPGSGKILIAQGALWCMAPALSTGSASLFIFAKLFWILAQPLMAAFCAGIASLAATIAGFRRTALCCGLFSSLVLFVALLTTTGNLMIQDLEDRFPKPSLPPVGVACIIVLGGGISTDVATESGGYDLTNGGDRYIETIRLARTYPDAKIVMSGGDGTLEQAYVSEAEIIGRMFRDFGIEDDRVINDDASRDTYENALHIKAILARENLSGCLLVTSGFHMPRAVAIFRTLAIEIIPWVADYRSTGREKLRLKFTNPIENADALTVATREWIGMLAYYLAGRIDTIP